MVVTLHYPLLVPLVSFMGHSIAQVVSYWLPTATAGFEPWAGHVGFVVDRVAMGQVFSKYFGFPCHSFHRLLHAHYHPSSGAATIGQIVANTPSHPKKLEELALFIFLPGSSSCDISVSSPFLDGQVLTLSVYGPLGPLVPSFQLPNPMDVLVLTTCGLAGDPAATFVA
jgi:hypothetical protein